MKHWRRGALCVLIGAVGCDSGSPVEPPADDEPVATAEEIAAYLPALIDVQERILASGGDPPLLAELSAVLTDLDRALVQRRARGAQSELELARALLEGCDDPCLVAPERSVVALTLDHASFLIGIEPTISYSAPARRPGLTLTDADHANR